MYHFTLSLIQLLNSSDKAGRSENKALNWKSCVRTKKVIKNKIKVTEYQRAALSGVNFFVIWGISCEVVEEVELWISGEHSTCTLHSSNFQMKARYGCKTAYRRIAWKS